MSERPPGFRTTTEKVSPEHPAYEEDQYDSTEFAHGVVYGMRLLETYDLIKEWDTYSENTRQFLNKERHERELQSCSKDIEAGLKNILERNLSLEDLLRGSAVYRFLRLGFAGSPEAQRLTLELAQKASIEELRESALVDSLEGEVSPEEVLAEFIEDRLIAEESIPPALWAEIVRGNTVEVQELEQEIQRLLPEMKESFLEYMQQSLGAYGISEEELAVLAERIEKVAVNVAGPLAFREERIGGTYEADLNQILIGAQLVFRERGGRRVVESIYFHEAFHLISGRLVYRNETREEKEEDEPENDMDDEFGIEDFTHGRIGLMFTGRMEAFGEPVPNARVRFRWLNEAVTERLSHELMRERGSNAPPAYPDEISILEYLCTKGEKPIPLGLFVGAYVENYEPDQAAETTVPRWRELRGALNESFGSDFLVALDEHIREVGSKQALADLESGAFPGGTARKE